MTGFDRLHPAVQHHIVNSLGWTSLRPTQTEAIAPIIDGRDVLLLAPTAGGKTEAAVLPVLSRMLSEQWTGLSVLYVCPLRALLNNLEPRLDRYAGLLGRSVALWHGDVGSGPKRAALRNPPDLLLTTPESIEAILISGAVDHAALFAELRAVIVDELHAFASDDRGWHLLALLERLGRLTGRHLQRIGLSATVGNPEALAAWLAHGEGAQVIGQSTGGTDGDVTIDHVGSLDNAAVVLSRLHRGEKRLVFCDSRARVETLGAELRRQGTRTFVSHSSLSRDERKQAEDAFGQAADCAIVATSTLELGIDVGDLDRVIQIDAASTVSSFLQRMGRTGRRPNSTRNCLFLATTDEAFLTAAAIVRLWRSGFVEPILPPPKPLHVFAQQILALVLQGRGLALQRWPEWIGRTFASIADDEIFDVIDYMLNEGVLFQDQGILGIGPRGEAKLGRRNFLDLLSVFTTPLHVTVRNGTTELGQVAPSSLLGIAGQPPIILLSGRSWRVVDIDWKRRLAWVEPSNETGRSRWPGSSRVMHFDLCRAVESTLVTGEVPAALSKRGAARLEMLCEDFAFCDGQSLPMVIDDAGGACLWTFAGAAVNDAMEQALDRGGFHTRSHDNFGIRLDAPDLSRLPEALASLSPEKIELEMPNDLEVNLKFSVCLPRGHAKAVAVDRLTDSRGLTETLARPTRLLRASSD